MPQVVRGGEEPQLRFIRVPVEHIYFKQYIEDDFKRFPMPETMRKTRNRAIILVAVQVIFAVVSIILWERRRNKIILAATIASIIMSVLGLIGTIRINSWLMFFHSFYFCSFLGAFYIYLLLDMLFFDDPSPDGHKLTDAGIMFLLSIPFLIDFAIGIYSMYLFNMVYDERKMRKNEMRQGGNNINNQQ